MKDLKIRERGWVQYPIALFRGTAVFEAEDLEVEWQAEFPNFSFGDESGIILVTKQESRERIKLSEDEVKELVRHLLEEINVMGPAENVPLFTPNIR